MPAARSAVIDDSVPGRLLCRRRFGCPTCLDPHEAVWLVIEGPLFPGDVLLNEEPLGSIAAASAAAEFDVTSRLRERNELVFNFDLARPASADSLLFTDVRLEIRG
jgi:hypothetical protein